MLSYAHTQNTLHYHLSKYTIVELHIAGVREFNSSSVIPCNFLLLSVFHRALTFKWNRILANYTILIQIYGKTLVCFDFLPKYLLVQPYISSDSFECHITVTRAVQNSQICFVYTLLFLWSCICKYTANGVIDVWHSRTIQNVSKKCN